MASVATSYRLQSLETYLTALLSIYVFKDLKTSEGLTTEMKRIAKCNVQQVKVVH